MVQRITRKQFEEKWGDGAHHSVGRFFTCDEIIKATEKHLWKELKDYIKQIECDGVEVMYFCSEDSIEGEKGKILFFTIRKDTSTIRKEAEDPDDVDYDEADIILGLLTQISEGKRAEIETKHVFGVGFLPGLVQAPCPLF